MSEREWRRKSDPVRAESQLVKGRTQNCDIPPGNQKGHKDAGRDHPRMPKTADEGGGAGGTKASV